MSDNIIPFPQGKLREKLVRDLIRDIKSIDSSLKLLHQSYLRGINLRNTAMTQLNSSLEELYAEGFDVSSFFNEGPPDDAA